jgi:hypothetical protein
MAASIQNLIEEVIRLRYDVDTNTERLIELQNTKLPNMNLVFDHIEREDIHFREKEKLLNSFHKKAQEKLSTFCSILNKLI